MRLVVTIEVFFCTQTVESNALHRTHVEVLGLFFHKPLAILMACFAERRFCCAKGIMSGTQLSAVDMESDSSEANDAPIAPEGHYIVPSKYQCQSASSPSTSSRVSGCSLPPYWYVNKADKSSPPPGGRKPPITPLPAVAPLRPNPEWTSVNCGISGCSLPPGWTTGRDQKSWPPGKVPPLSRKRSVEYLSDDDQPIIGVCGFDNLGNTCFMGSALQCLSQCGLLTAYFLTGGYEKDMNRDNPLGTGGKLALQYAKLLTIQWGGKCSSFAPREFRMALATFCPLLQDMGQHDAQEFLMTLLDGLHEDLNVVLEKPYITDQLESDGCADEILAAVAWHRHQLRNRSFIVDTFQGQLKSTIRCNRCDNVSVTFDPVTFFTLPARTAIDTYVVIPILFRSLDYNEPLKRYSCRILRTALLRDLQSCLAHLAGVPRDHIVVRDIHLSRVWCAFEHGETVDVIGPNDRIFGYQLSEAFVPDDEDSETSTPGPQAGHARATVLITLLQFCFERQWKRVEWPMIFTVDRHIGTAALYDLVHSHLPSSLRNEMLDEEMDEEDVFDEEMYPFSLALVDKQGELCDDRGIRHREGFPLDDRYATVARLCRMVSFNEIEGITVALKWRVQPDAISSPVVNDASVLRNEQWKSHYQSRAQLSLHDCWQSFIEEEQLGESDTWYCSKCKEHRAAFKRLQLFRVPRILIVHLKRFQFTGAYRRKIDTLVDYPIEGMDLAPYIAQPLPEGQAAIYDLIGVVHHLGMSIEYGHYTATTKHANDGEWYRYDDDEVSRCTDENLQHDATAYLLFYKLRDQLQ